MKIALKPIEIRLLNAEGSKEELYFMSFQLVAMTKSELETFISKMNEENEIILEVK